MQENCAFSSVITWQYCFAYSNLSILLFLYVFLLDILQSYPKTRYLDPLHFYLLCLYIFTCCALDRFYPKIERFLDSETLLYLVRILLFLVRPHYNDDLTYLKH